MSVRKLFARILCLVFMLACFGCRKPDTQIPGGVLKPEKMVDLLADIHVAQAAASLHSTVDTTYVTFAEYAPDILKNHGVTAGAYDSSLAFYSAHPDLLDSIYKAVIDTLSKRQSEEEGRSR